MRTFSNWKTEAWQVLSLCIIAVGNSFVNVLLSYKGWAENEAVLERVESTAAAWMAMFDNPLPIKWNFIASENGKLLLNGVELCDVDAINLSVIQR